MRDQYPSRPLALTFTQNDLPLLPRSVMNPNTHYGQKNTIVALPTLPQTLWKSFSPEKKKKIHFQIQSTGSLGSNPRLTAELGNNPPSDACQLHWAKAIGNPDSPVRSGPIQGG